MVLGKLDSYMQKNKIGTLPNTIHKDKLKMERPETIKLFTVFPIEEDIGRTLDDTNESKILYDSPLRVTEMKTKINKLDPVKFKGFCTAKKKL